MATLKDIAKETGVSIMTVSRALNAPVQVTKELRNNIIDAAQRLGYIPHHGARFMANNKTGIIQVITALKTTDHYFLTLFAGIADYLSENDYALILGRTDKMKYKCDGIIVMSVHIDEAKTFFKSLSVPCVLFGKSEEATDYVDINNELGAYLVTKHLIDLGHKKIGYLGIESKEHFARERLHGYFKAIKSHGLDVSFDYVVSCDNKMKAGREAAKELLQNCDITAIACASDLLAMAAIEAGKYHGKIVPNDLSVVGFDGFFLDQIAVPRLTTAVQSVYEIGRKLSEIIIKRINSPEMKQEKIVLDPILRFGESTKPICDTDNGIRYR